MQCHDLTQQLSLPAGARRIVLAGNPNVGKSVVFHALTGIYVDVANYPGTTLEIAYGGFGQDVVLDTPGIYGVSSFNDEEVLARDVILSADIVINIVNAVHLERDLFLTLQVIDMGLPVIVALNMMDEAERRGLQIDVTRLGELLGVPVAPMVAVEKKGIAELINRVSDARPGNTDEALLESLQAMLPAVGTQGAALLVVEGDPHVAARYNVLPGEQRESIYLQRRERVNAVVNQVVCETTRGAAFSARLGHWMLKPLTGIPILAFTLWVMYWFIGVLIAQTVVGITEGSVMRGLYEPLVRALAGRVLANSSILGQLLTGEFGILTMTVTYILGLLLPLVVGFYLALSSLEDAGYLPRIAVLVDRLLTGIGLNGRGVIPLILGFGCVTMATITTRMLGSDRERRIATFLLALAIPCSAQLAVITGMLAGLGMWYVLLYGAIIVSVLVIVGTLMNRILPGQSSDLFIDLPPLRWPRPENVIRKTAAKSMMFIREAAPLFAIGALLLGVMQVSGLLGVLQNLMAPVTEGWLRLPRETARAFIMGFVRRDFGQPACTTCR